MAQATNALGFAQLASTSPRPDVLRFVLADEESQGRIERSGNDWRIVPGAFPPDLLAAIAALDLNGNWAGR